MDRLPPLKFQPVAEMTHAQLKAAMISLQEKFEQANARELFDPSLRAELAAWRIKAAGWRRVVATELSKRKSERRASRDSMAFTVLKAAAFRAGYKGLDQDVAAMGEYLMAVLGPVEVE